MDDELRAELLRRMDQDQVARVAMDTEAMTAVDGENLPWLKELIAARGWPGASLVGVDGAHAAWLLVQHMDADPAFQRQCLGLLTAAAANGEATPAEGSSAATTAGSRRRSGSVGEGGGQPQPFG